MRAYIVRLGVMAIVIGLVIAVPVGIYSAIRRNSAADYVGRTAAVIGLATPNFWLALMVMIFPAIWWGWSPRRGPNSRTDRSVSRCPRSSDRGMGFRQQTWHLS